MRMVSFRAMTGAIIVIAVICATGLASAQPFPPPTMQPQQPQNDSAGAAMQVSSGQGDKLFPAISGERIVWFDNESFSVQLYDISSGNTSIISDQASVPLLLSYQLAVAGNNVVWSGINTETEGINVYLYDTASGSLQQVTNGSGMHVYPGASEENLIWTNLSNGSSDVYFYEIASDTVMPVVIDPYFQAWTDIGGDTMAWADNETEDGDTDIAVAFLDQRDISLWGRSGDDLVPDVSSDGSRVAWISVLENRTAVYLYDVATDNATRITGASARPTAVAVDGNLVVYSDLRNGNLDIYRYDISTGTETQVTEDPYAQAFPDVSDGEMVWMGNTTGQWEIYRASAGGQQAPQGQNQSGQPGMTPSPTMTIPSSGLPEPLPTGAMPGLMPPATPNYTPQMG